MRRMSHVRLLTAAFVLFVAMPGEAQIRRPAWGVSAAATPEWHVPDHQRQIYDADRIDLSGSEFRVGIVRGETRTGDWGISYVQRGVKEGGTVLTTTEQGSSVERTVAAKGRLYGIEIHRFVPFTTIRDRAQIGLQIAVGVGRWAGTITQSVDGGPLEPTEASSLLSVLAKASPVLPLARLEFAGAAIVTPRIKIRMSGGVSLPGVEAFSVGLVYLFGGR